MRKSRDASVTNQTVKVLPLGEKKMAYNSEIINNSSKAIHIREKPKFACYKHLYNTCMGDVQLANNGNGKK